MSPRRLRKRWQLFTPEAQKVLYIYLWKHIFKKNVKTRFLRNNWDPWCKSFYMLSHQQVKGSVTTCHQASAKLCRTWMSCCRNKKKNTFVTGAHRTLTKVRLLFPKSFWRDFSLNTDLSFGVCSSPVGLKMAVEGVALIRIFFYVIARLTRPPLGHAPTCAEVTSNWTGCHSFLCLSSVCWPGISPPKARGQN